MILRIVPASEAHEAFIVDTWLRSYRRASEVREVPPDLYSAGMRARVAWLRRGSTTLVAESEGVYIGWACYYGQSIHYAFVKKNYRRQGVASKLLAGFTGDSYTHRNAGAWNSVLERRGLKYRPEKGRP